MTQKPYTKALLALCLATFFSLLFIAACNKNQKSESIIFPNEIAIPAITTNSNPGLEGVLGKKIEGSATIYSLESGEIIIAIKKINESQAKEKFILQTEKNLSYKPGISEISNVEIIYLFDILLVNDRDKNIVTSYTVNSPRLNETYSFIPEDLQKRINTSVTGYGLGYNSASWSFLNKNIALEKSLHTLLHGYETNYNPPGGGSPCTAGGVGSTSCSISGCFGESCSTSCGAGYHSCCYCDDVLPDLGPHCDCVKND